MTSITPGLILEALLVLLLIITVGYCVILNGRLGRLRSSQAELRQIVTDLTQATANAETAIRGLKETTQEAEAKLSEKLHRAQLLTRKLSGHTAEHEVATAAAPAPVEPVTPIRPTMVRQSDAGEAVAQKPNAPRDDAAAAVASAVMAAAEQVRKPSLQKAAPDVDREAWRRHALSRLKRAS